MIVIIIKQQAIFESLPYVSVTFISALHGHLLIFTTKQWSRYFCYSHYTAEKTEFMVDLVTRLRSCLRSNKLGDGRGTFLFCSIFVCGMNGYFNSTPSFHRWGNWGSERSRDLPNVTQLVSGRARMRVILVHFVLCHGACIHYACSVRLSEKKGLG